MEYTFLIYSFFKLRYVNVLTASLKLYPDLLSGSFWLAWIRLSVQKLNIQKCKVLHIGSKNITAKYKLNNKEIKEVNEESNLGVGFDDTFKVDNHIFSTEGKWNDWLDG